MTFRQPSAIATRKTNSHFSDATTRKTSAVALSGEATPGVTVTVDLQRVQWNSVRTATGNGFYSWETKRKEIPAGTWTVTSEAQPVSLHVPITDGGEYVLIARASDARGRS